MTWSNTTGTTTGAGANQNTDEFTSAFKNQYTQTSTSGTESFKYDPETEKAINILLGQLSSGGTANQKAEIQKRSNAGDLIYQLLGEVSKSKAFSDAEGLMAQEMRKTLENQNPALRKAVQGAGTSAASMQGLLANDIAARAGEASAAQAALQERVYAGERTKLASILDSLTKPSNTVEDSLIRLLAGIKSGTTTKEVNTTTNTLENSNSNTQRRGTGGGGGSRSGGSSGGGGTRGSDGGYINAVPGADGYYEVGEGGVTQVGGGNDDGGGYTNYEDDSAYTGNPNYDPRGTGGTYDPGTLTDIFEETGNTADNDYGGPGWEDGTYDPGNVEDWVWSEPIPEDAELYYPEP